MDCNIRICLIQLIIFQEEFENTLLNPATCPTMYHDTLIHQIKMKYSILRVPMAIEYTFPKGIIQPSLY